MTSLLLREALLDTGSPADVLLSDGVIAAIGAPGTVDAAGAEEVALGGRYLSPGLWDAHLHFTQYVIQRRRFDLTRARSAAETLDLVRAELRAHPRDPGEVFVGYGFRDGTWPDAPTREGIDALGANVPVVLISGDLHCAWLDRTARERWGIETDATGLARENAWINAAKNLGEAEALTDEAFREAALAAARRGVVGVVEYEHADNLRDWPARVAAGVDLLRVEAAVWPDRLDEAIALGVRTGDPLDVAGSPHPGLVRMGRLKVVVDGSLNTRTALCWDPYPAAGADHGHPYGIASVPVDDLRELLIRAREAGIEAAVHAIGDRANSDVLDTFESLRMRGIIEHAQLVAERDFPRFAALGVIASVQPEHAMDDRDVADIHWAGRTGRAFAFGSLLAAGAELRLGSDAPVAALDPWISISAATTRARSGRAPWHPEQIIPFEVAHAASVRSRVAVGEVADLAVLDRDPALLSGEELRTLPVAATLLAGRFTWNAL
ncbi:amidohydrolase [Pseudolysinimonas sp.]|jgi:predicted amidohydrolase YtcJ|uniref:amidohydrolase n=1 Tax=Pseudolysinimonas sp. TaxID=2680009 RepID=UPI0037845E53